jgi:hypothetical protein
MQGVYGVAGLVWNMHYISQAGHCMGALIHGPCASRQRHSIRYMRMVDVVVIVRSVGYSTEPSENSMFVLTPCLPSPS